MRSPDEETAFLAAAAVASGDAVIGMTLDTERITFWNAGAERLYGWTAAEMIGRPFRVLVPPDEYPAFDTNRHALTTGSLSTILADVVRLRKDGGRVFVSTRVSVVRDPVDGEALGIYVVARDITERRLLEAEMLTESERQRHVAQTLQRSLLMVPPPDTFPGVSVKPLYQSADDDVLVGGDFFDIFAVTRDRIALVVGDATGKGLEAATYTAEIKFALRAFLQDCHQLDVALNRLNSFIVNKQRLHHGGLQSTYVALAVCVLDTQTGELQSSCAGIEPPFLLQALTDEVLPLSEGCGPLLGIMAQAEYECHRLTLANGDVLAMFTDGLTEARLPETYDFFGYARLTDAVREAVTRLPSLSDAGRAVADRARSFAGGRINDDICLLLARRKED